jgi:UPF0755 protein
MRNRQAADQRLEQIYSRPSGALARSPAERLEPTRPPARPRAPRSREPRRSSPLLRFVNGLLTLVLVLMLVAGAGAFLFDAELDAPGPLDRRKAVAIPKGEGTHEIAARLEREGVVKDRRLFIAGYMWSRLSAQLEGGRPVQLRAGDYAVKERASIRQVIELLSEGKTIAHRVTVPEGLTSHQIVERLKAEASLSGEIEGVPEEGALLPDTYVVEQGMPRQALLERMQAEARKFQERAWTQRHKDVPLKSMEEAVILASIVEKETGRNHERERVAAVFINRLRLNMRLQSDPTILYGLGGGKTAWGRPILRSEIGQKTSHNTYQIDGLPPTPICNPGRAAIEAVLNPAQTKELYFVADGNGGHIFAETLKDHNANVQKWRALEKDIRAKTAPVPASGDVPAPTVSQPAAPKSPNTRAVVRTLPDAKAQQRPAAKAKGPQQPQSQKETPAASPPPAKASP